MNDTPSLFAECPLPGCTYPVDDPRWPCGECEAALAGYIRAGRGYANCRAGPAGPATDSDSGSCGTRCQPGVQAKPALLGLRGTPHLPARHGPPRPLDMQDVRGDHMTRLDGRDSG